MAGDMVVALGRVTADGHTLFAGNSHRPPRDCQVLHRTVGRDHALGEKVQTQCQAVAQARQTCTVLGSQPAGFWGYSLGVNEHGVAMGCTHLRSRLQCTGPGLLGADLVRLCLERAHSANQAVDIFTDLVERHGQGQWPNCPPQAEGDSAFLIATANEAFVIEAAGNHWAFQQIEQVRAVSDVSTIRQDWGRISRGLSSLAIAQGWWPSDGSKLDFAEAVGEDPIGTTSALRRWGRATYLLEHTSKKIDLASMRQLLGDHYHGMYGASDPLGSSFGPAPLCQHGRGAGEFYTGASLIVRLRSERGRPLFAWYAFGPPCLSVYLPIFLDGDLPEPFSATGEQPSAGSVWWRTNRLQEQLRRDPDRRHVVSEGMSVLQARLDQEAEEFVAEALTLKKQGAGADVARLAGIFMQHSLERYVELLDGLFTPTSRGSWAGPPHGPPPVGVLGR